MLLTEWHQEEALEVAREEAREEGLAEGREKEKLIIAKSMLENGSSLEFVHKITGLSMDTVEAIKVNL
jgi:predicted transposase/invertase (TIGR01784 family)